MFGQLWQTELFHSQFICSSLTLLECHCVSQIPIIATKYQLRLSTKNEERFTLAHSLKGFSPQSLCPLLWVCGYVAHRGPSTQERRHVSFKPFSVSLQKKTGGAGVALLPLRTCFQWQLFPTRPHLLKVPPFPNITTDWWLNLKHLGLLGILVQTVVLYSWPPKAHIHLIMKNAFTLLLAPKVLTVPTFLKIPSPKSHLRFKENSAISPYVKLSKRIIYTSKLQWYRVNLCKRKE
jgi:hypothetical protein